MRSHVFGLAIGVMLMARGLAAQDPQRQAPTGRPVTVAYARHEIPNEYLDVTVTNGRVLVIGSADDSVRWSMSEPAPAGLIGGHAAYGGSATFTDRMTLAIADRSTVPGPGYHPVVQIRVPRTFKLLRITLVGSGSVDVTRLSGEIDVVVDSGSISGNDLQGPIVFEARHGSIGLDLTDRAAGPGTISLLSHYGSTELVFGPNPSASLVLVANCGNVHLDTVLESMMRTGAIRNSPLAPGDPGPDADCAERPAALPPLPGVIHLRNNLQLQVGSGRTIIHSMALQGDINIRVKQ